MWRRATQKDVADEVGVDVGTVSRALNPRQQHLVNPETRRKIRHAAHKLGYQRNPFGGGLRTSRSQSVGVLVPDLQNPIFPPLIRGIEAALLAVNHIALVANTDMDPRREKTLFDGLQERRVDGFIVATAQRKHPLLVTARRMEIPMVLAIRTVDGLDVSAVVSDDVGGTMDAVRHLATLGHRDIACLAGPLGLSTGLVRLEAFRSAMAAVGLHPDERLIVACSSYQESAGAEAMRTLLAHGMEFTAVVAGNDLIALGCYDALESAGLRCPDDISVVGFNDMVFADKFRPPLTTVRPPLLKMGERAARLLLEQLEGPASPRTECLPVELVVRGSTAAPPAPARPRDRQRPSVTSRASGRPRPSHAR